MHVRVSAPAIFWDTPLNWSSLWYYQLVEYQLLYCFLRHLPWPVKMVKKSKFPLWDRSIFCNFKNASPRKCSVIFWETPLNWSALGYCKLVEFQRLYSFLPRLTCPVYMVEKPTKITMSEITNIFQLSKCMSASLLWPFSETLHSITLLYGTTNWHIISYHTHVYPTYHDL